MLRWVAAVLMVPWLLLVSMGVEQCLDQLAEDPELVAHGRRVLHGATEDESALEGGKEVIGERVGVDVDRGLAASKRRAEQVDEFTTPRFLGPADLAIHVGAGELPLGEHGGEEATRLFGHQRVGAVLVEAQERHDSLCGVLDADSRPESGVEMGQIGSDVALHEGGSEIGLGVEVVEEGSFRAGRLSDHLVDRRRVVTLIGHQPLGNLQDPFTGWATVSRHIPHCSRPCGLLQPD